MAYFAFNFSLRCSSIHKAGVRYFTNVVDSLMFDTPACKSYPEVDSIANRNMWVMYKNATIKYMLHYKFKSLEEILFENI
jgi:hypothetical protein